MSGKSPITLTTLATSPIGGFCVVTLEQAILTIKVARKIRVALPWTALLNILAVVLAYFLAIPLGVYMAKYQGKVFDRATTIILFILYSLRSSGWEP